jgi:hypothetical protein
VEIEFEGSEDFLKQELPELLKTAMALRKASGNDDGGGKTPGGAGAAGKGGAGIEAATTGTIAARLNVKSGPALLIAAAARMTLVSKKDTFSRQELLTEMQGASQYYRKSYSNNLTSYLRGCVESADLSETASNTYALTAAKKGLLEKQLANG